MTYFPPNPSPVVVDGNLLDLHVKYHCHFDVYAAKTLVAPDAYTSLHWLLSEGVSGPWLNTGTVGGSNYDLIREPASPYPPYYGPTGTLTTVAAPADGYTAPNAASGAVRLITNTTAAKAGLGNGSCSVSAWVRLAASSPWGRIIEKKWLDDNSWSPPYIGGIMLTMDAGGTGIHSYVTYGTSTSQNWNAGVSLTLGQWYLISETFDASTGTFLLYMNGVLKYTSTSYGATNLAWGAGRWETMKSGNPSGEELKGSVFDIRVEMGVVRSASYYLAMYNALQTAIVDVSLAPKATTLVGTAIDTTNKKFGVGSLLFNGSGDYILFSGNDVGSFFGFDEWTIELWVYPTALPAGGGYGSPVFDSLESGTTTGPALYLLSTGAILGGCTTSGGVFNATSSTGLVTTNTWYHLAMQRERVAGAPYLGVYLNGTRVANRNLSDYAVTATHASGWYFGRSNLAGPRYFTGNMDEMRVTGGVARYPTTGFTPSVAAFSNPAYPALPSAAVVRKSSLGDYYICSDPVNNKWRRLQLGAQLG
jgi:hypothetical protein